MTETYDEYTKQLLESEDPADQLAAKIRMKLISEGIDPDSVEVVGLSSEYCDNDVIKVEPVSLVYERINLEKE